MNHTTIRRGMTLVELLAVIAIIGLLVALLMPALQSARESSRRTTCTNNLKQMALASLTHLEQIGTFPSAGWCNDGFGSRDQGGLQELQPGSWMFNLLPFLDEVNLRNFAAGTSACGRMPRVFACPTMPGWFVRDSSGSFPDGGYNVSSYAGCSGSRANNPTPWCQITGAWVPSYSAGQTKWWREIPDTTQTPVGDRERWWQQCWGYGHDKGNNPGYVNGVIAALGRVRAAHVRDGLSNTYFAGERSVQIAGDDISVRNNGGNIETFYDWTWGYQRGLIKFTTNPPEQFKAGFTGSNNFGSRHSGGFGMAFCDGSVRFIGYDVSATVHSGLGTRNGGDASGPID
jgi:prepilin-type N-terminal cleavage/methylation domain-containing protein/prepilin-type processing-associated H-X9-DG protein